MTRTTTDPRQLCFNLAPRLRRGRPATTRARVLAYWRANPLCAIMQIVRDTGADRRHVQRILRAG